jgi:hypothetical protein
MWQKSVRPQMQIILFFPSMPALSMIRVDFYFVLPLKRHCWPHPKCLPAPLSFTKVVLFGYSVGTGKRLNGGLYTPIQPFSRFFLYKGTRQNVGILKKCKLYYKNRPGGPALSMISLFYFIFLNAHSMASWRRIPGVRFPKANDSCIWQQSRFKCVGFYGGESAM